MSSKFALLASLGTCLAISLNGTVTHAQFVLKDETSQLEEDTPTPVTELIRERYPDRKIKIEREVTQDASQNYINHGTWKMWDPQGNRVVEGLYEHNKRHGTWNRWYRNGETPLLRTVPYRLFRGPYISQATFKNGYLDGHWTIYDAKQNKISHWEFANGRRHGAATWYYANGRKMRQATYKDGVLDGELIEWSLEGAQVKREVYQEGRQLAKRTEYHKGTVKKSEGVYLFAKLALQTPDDWWNAKLATYVKQGQDEKHGAWSSWFATGQPKMQGEYRHDAPVGKFTWWYSNGQKSLEAEYVDGKQNGKWNWWHENGQKSIAGGYTNGDPTGLWMWWQESGKVAQRADFSESKGRILAMPKEVGKDLSPESTSRRAAGPQLK